MWPGMGLHRRDRIADHQGGGHAVVQQGVDEGGVGAVLQQAADQIGQQVLVPAHRRIGPQHHVGAEARVRRGVERLAHAVQALVLDLHPRFLGHGVDGGQGVGVVGGELGIEGGRGGDQRLGGHQVGEVGGRLGGVDWIAWPSRHLGALDLAVPVGALDQAHHDPAPRGARQLRHPLDHLDRALLVGLHHHAEAGPGAELALAGQSLQQLERQHQPVRLLRIEGEVQVVARGEHRQALQPRVQLAPDPRLLRRLVAGAERRELHRDAVAALGPRASRGPAHRLDGAGVELFIPGGVLRRAGAFAQHVEGAERALLAGAAQRLLDGAAEHELLAHDPHGGRHRLAHHRLAEPARQPLDEAADVAPGVIVHVHQLAGQHQPPGGGVDEQAVGPAEVRGPVGGADLLGDQLVAGILVGRAQQRLGQAHQRQAFLGAQRELLQEALHHALALGGAAGGAHQGLGLGVDQGAGGVVQRAGGEKGRDRLALVAVLVGVEGVPVLQGGHGGAPGQVSELRCTWDRGEGASLHTRLC